MLENEEWLKARKQVSSACSGNQLLSNAIFALVEVSLGESVEDVAHKLPSAPQLSSPDQSRFAAIIYYILAVLTKGLGDSPRVAKLYAQTCLREQSQSCIPLPDTWKQTVQTLADEVLPAFQENKNSNNNNSGSNESYERIKQSSKEPPKALGKMMELIGLKEVKECFMNAYHRATIAREQRSSLATANYNARFEGNPGTGKTTVARLYCELLIQVEVLPENSVSKETTGSELVYGGVKKLEEILDEVKDAGGGVVFVDEAYQLSPKENPNGRQVSGMVFYCMYVCVCVCWLYFFVCFIFVWYSFL